ncbi:MAG: hypothetical protein KC668_27470 [Myxococcales bacterium]|nr:hypothetical protein [Myxococcales bacterium]
MKIWVGVLASWLALATLPAFAARVEAQSDLVDAVVTDDGAMYRGVLVEYVPGSHVVLRTPTGDRRFEYATIVFAGPAERAPDPATVAERRAAAAEPVAAAAAPEPSPVEGSTAEAEGDEGAVRVDVVSPREGLTLHNLAGLSYASVQGLQPGTAGYARVEHWAQLCTAPCVARLIPGTHYFRVVGPDGTIYGRRRGVDIDGPGELSISHRSRHRKRRWLWATTAIGIAVGAAGILVGVRDSLGYPEPRNPRIYPGGLVVGSVFAVVGLGALVTIGVGGGRPSAEISFRRYP